MENKKVAVIICISILVIIMILICNWLYQNTGLRGFEKEVSNISLPEKVEKISIKSGIGDSGGNGNYSTYRVVLVVKTKMSIDELKNEFDNKEMTFLTHTSNSGLPYVYISKYESNVFISDRNFKIVFDDLENVEDYSEFYYLEFIK